MVTQTASYFGPESKAKLLLGKEADFTIQGGDFGNSPQAASYGDELEIVKMPREREGFTATHYRQRLQEVLYASPRFY